MRILKRADMSIIRRFWKYKISNIRNFQLHFQKKSFDAKLLYDFFWALIKFGNFIVHFMKYWTIANIRDNKCNNKKNVYSQMTFRLILGLNPVPTEFLAPHTYWPSSALSTVKSSSDGLNVVLPLYLEVCFWTSSATPSFVHVTEVAPGLASTTLVGVDTHLLILLLHYSCIQWENLHPA